MYKAHGLGSCPKRSRYLASNMARIGPIGGAGKAPDILTDAINALISAGACGGYMTGEKASLLPYHLTRVRGGSSRAWAKMFRASGGKRNSRHARAVTANRR